MTTLVGVDVHALTLDVLTGFKGRIRNVVIGIWLPMSVCLPSLPFGGWLFCWVKTCGEGGKEFRRRRGGGKWGAADLMSLAAGRMYNVKKWRCQKKQLAFYHVDYAMRLQKNYYRSLSTQQRQVSHSLDKQWMILEEQPKDETLTLCSFTFPKHRNTEWLIKGV